MKSNYEFLMQKNATNALFEFHIKETCKNRKKNFVFMFIQTRYEYNGKIIKMV